MENIKQYLQKLIAKWDKYEVYGGAEALSFQNDIEMLLEYWDERIEPLERIPEETKHTAKELNHYYGLDKSEADLISDKDYNTINKLIPINKTKSQSGEREEVCSICGGLLDSDSYAYGGKYPVHITCSLNARKIYIGSKDKNGELKPSEYLKDLLSESKKECLEECIKLSDEIEQGKDTTTEEWRAFKQFRNTLRDMEKKERELKFRVFLDNKMIYIENQKGKKHSAETAHILIQNGIQEPFDNDGEDPLELVFDGSGIHLYSLWDGWDKIEIERDYILMQSTGLEDKNGKEIYEGDIVTDGQEVVVIEFDNDIGAGCAPFIEVAMSGWQCSDGSDAEVIGNIYENPELIS